MKKHFSLVHKVCYTLYTINKMLKKEVKKMCYMCKKCCGIMKLVVGVLVLLNAFVWPLWSGIDGWIAFFGALMVLGGLIMIIAPTAKCCANACGMEKSKKK